MKALKEIGTAKMFGSDAQPRGISDRPLKVNKGIQKAFRPGKGGGSLLGVGDVHFS